MSSRVKPNMERSRSIRRVRSGGGTGKGTIEGDKVSVSASYLWALVSFVLAKGAETHVGTRCLGHGTNPNS